ncbi:MAG: LytTR family transcriptional regulator [Ruminococcaceae bacterium]|nr:LytTR family transcriptional regulator [Oscillospiraceae bacterium]
MDSTASNVAEKEKIKAKLIELMEQNNIAYSLLECCGEDRLCVDFSGKENDCKRHFCKSGFIVQTGTNTVRKIYPHEILYIAIENRKSVLYLTDTEIKTNYSLEYWKRNLDEKIFVQPHSSYIVNLSYVSELTKDIVKVSSGKKEYRVYTSQRKIGAFRKALLTFDKYK